MTCTASMAMPGIMSVFDQHKCPIILSWADEESGTLAKSSAGDLRQVSNLTRYRAIMAVRELHWEASCTFCLLKSQCF